MYKITRKDFYTKKEMKKGKKRHWGFTCPSCKEKFSSKSHTEYCYCEEHLTGPLDEISILCSVDCVFDYLKSLSIDVDGIIKEHNKMMDKLYELDRE
ncbi:hypothetical protein [Peribacillus sp. TH24]|uniref:hypothetical protein n=1 Tax=Peribacillus sp. TH24 TaxID=2798483 RepID=UPI001911E6D0|nr:hypothetical protein [Peribacillus sp. TH24]MBK5446079.1 hypothetical protein [Peribacillus sp. TH24]